MSEIKTEMKLFLVDMICNECNYGRMRPTGMAYTSNPPKYPHKCDRCGHEVVYLTSYPKYVQEPV